jgi:sigma-B regulation protein RsbQ
MAPIIMGNPDRPELGDELTNSFCMTDPEIAKQFARVTFLSDNRSDLPAVKARCLVLQCSGGCHRAEKRRRICCQQLPNSRFTILSATSHCPNLSTPEETVSAMKLFLESPPDRVGLRRS